MITFLTYLGTAIVAGALVAFLYKKKIEKLHKKCSELLNGYNEAVSNYIYLKSAYDRKCAEVIDMKNGLPHGNNSQIVKKLMERVNIAERKLMENGLL